MSRSPHRADASMQPPSFITNHQPEAVKRLSRLKNRNLAVSLFRALSFFNRVLGADEQGSNLASTLPGLFRL